MRYDEVFSNRNISKLSVAGVILLNLIESTQGIYIITKVNKYSKLKTN